MQTRKGKRVIKENKTQKSGGGLIKPPYIYNKKLMQDYMTENINSNNLKTKNKIIKSIENKYQNKIIPKGTHIYRTSMELDPKVFINKEKGVVFFGLDAWISIWYGLEIWLRYRHDRHKISYNDWYVYFHEYEVIQPIKYEYFPDIEIALRYHNICKDKPCVHPQYIYRSMVNPIREIGTELTFPYEYPIVEYLQPFKTYKLNIIKLMEYQFELSGVLNAEFQNSLTNIAIENVLTRMDKKNLTKSIIEKYFLQERNKNL